MLEFSSELMAPRLSSEFLLKIRVRLFIGSNRSKYVIDSGLTGMFNPSHPGGDVDRAVEPDTAVVLTMPRNLASRGNITSAQLD